MVSKKKQSSSSGVFLPFFALALGTFLILSGVEYLLLGYYGKEATALVTHANKKSGGRTSSTYDIMYEFTTPDGRRFNGSESGFQRKPGSVKIRYWDRFPRINRVEATTAATVIMLIVYFVPGLAGTLFGLARFSVKAFSFSRNEEGELRDSPGCGMFLATLIALAIGFSAWAVDRQELFLDSPADDAATRLNPGKAGNTPGNLNQGGNFAFDGESLYYSEFGYKPIFQILDEEIGPEPFHEGLANWISISGDWVYFLQFDQGEGVHAWRKSKTGGKAEKIVDEDLTGLWIIGHWLYYTPKYMDNKLHRANPDGSRPCKLHDDIAKDVVFTAEWIFYCNGADNDRIYRMRHNGAERSQIGKVRAADLQSYGEWLIYRNQSDKNRIYIMKTDGSENGLLADADARCLNTDGKWLYYSDFSRSSCLYRIPVTGGTPEKITDTGVLSPHIIGDWIYVGAGSIMDGLNIRRFRSDDGSGRPGPLQEWPRK